MDTATKWSQPLPLGLRKTQGPSSTYDKDCPICHCEIEAQAVTVQHVGSLGCYRRFDIECMLSWLPFAEPPSCSMCRADLNIGDAIWQMHYRDRARHVRKMRAERQKPSEYQVMYDIDSTAKLLCEKSAPSTIATSLDRVAYDFENEVALTQAMLYTYSIFGSHPWRLDDDDMEDVGLEDVFDIQCLLGKKGDVKFDLDEQSIKSLWEQNRILAVQHWFVARVEACPDIGILVPVSRRCDVLLTRETEYDTDWSSRKLNKEVIQVPISTQVFDRYLRMRGGISGSRPLRWSRTCGRLLRLRATRTGGNSHTQRKAAALKLALGSKALYGMASAH